jgi:hypothetical protein
LVSSSSSAPCGFDDWLILYYWWNLCNSLMIPEHPQTIGRGNQRPSLFPCFFKHHWSLLEDVLT